MSRQNTGLAIAQVAIRFYLPADNIVFQDLAMCVCGFPNFFKVHTTCPSHSPLSPASISIKEIENVGKGKVGFGARSEICL